MNIKELMKLIKNDERFSNVFHFYGDDKSHVHDMLPTSKLRKQFSFVKLGLFDNSFTGRSYRDY